VSTPSPVPAARAAPREWPPASMIDAIVKPSGSLCSITAMNRMAPSEGLTMKPAAMATPSNTVCTPSPRTASQPAAGWSSASRWTSSPKWKCGATVCSNRWTPKYPSSTNRNACGTWVLSGSIRTKAAASMKPAPPATKYRRRA